MLIPKKQQMLLPTRSSRAERGADLYLKTLL